MLLEPTQFPDFAHPAYYNNVTHEAVQNNGVSIEIGGSTWIVDHD